MILSKDIAANLLNDINNGFYRPHLAYVHGLAENYLQASSDCVFSNYWMGPADVMMEFANHIATFYKKSYDKAIANNEVDAVEAADGLGFVGYWEENGVAMVASINFYQKLVGWNHPDEVHPGVKKVCNLFPDVVQVLWDGDDNMPEDIILNNTLQENYRMAACSFVCPTVLNDEIFESDDPVLITLAQKRNLLKQAL